MYLHQDSNPGLWNGIPKTRVRVLVEIHVFHLDEQKVEELQKAAIMADDYALTHKMSSKSGNPQQKRYHGSGNRENISRNMDDRKRQGKSTENVGLVSKVEPLKPISCGHCV